MRRQAATKQRRNLFERLRWPALIKRRDGWRCRVAGCATPRDRIEAHHLTPLAAGGASTLDNGVTLCRAHHLAIHRSADLAIAPMAADAPKRRKGRGDAR